MTVTAEVPATGNDETLVLEHRDPGIWVSEAMTRRDGGTVTGVADVVPPDHGPFALNRSDLRITVIGTADGGGTGRLPRLDARRRQVGRRKPESTALCDPRSRHITAEAAMNTPAAPDNAPPPKPGQRTRQFAPVKICAPHRCGEHEREAAPRAGQAAQPDRRAPVPRAPGGTPAPCWPKSCCIARIAGTTRRTITIPKPSP